LRCCPIEALIVAAASVVMLCVALLMLAIAEFIRARLTS